MREERKSFSCTDRGARNELATDPHLREMYGLPEVPGEGEVQCFVFCFSFLSSALHLHYNK